MSHPHLQDIQNYRQTQKATFSQMAEFWHFILFARCFREFNLKIHWRVRGCRIEPIVASLKRYKESISEKIIGVLSAALKLLSFMCVLFGGK